MPALRNTTLMAAALSAASITAASAIFLPDGGRLFRSDSVAATVDRSVKPGDDFYRYANGVWLRDTAAAGRANYDNRALLAERTKERVQDLVIQAASAHAEAGSVTRKVGDFYASLVDEQGINGKGLAPLAQELAVISGIHTRAGLSAYLGGTLNTEAEGLTANRDHVFGLWVNQGFQDSKRNFPHLMQGGLGMDEPIRYTDTSAKAAELRAKYEAHVGAMLRLGGVEDYDVEAQRVLSLEMEIAKTFASDADASDAFKQNNSWNRAYFDTKAPGMDWGAYFQSAGLAQQSDFIVWHPTAVIGISALVTLERLEQWKDYLRFHLVEHYATALPRALFLEHAAFRQQPSGREKAALDATNAALGQAVGQLYTRAYFPPAAKSKAEAMKRDLITAYRARLAKIAWMSPATRQKALAKLDALTIGVGYPERWIDYSALHVVPDDAFGNLRRAEAFERSRNLALLRDPADPGEWRIDPQVAGAVIVFSPNSEFFAAAILQPPYFDPQGDSASNYGSAGAAMAHEITHSFDELGNIYDAEGRLGLWWTENDLAEYHRAAAALAAQFAGYCPFRDLCLDGERTLNENAADLAGLVVAHHAYLLSLKGRTDVVIGGLTGEQRFFLAFAQRWRRVQSESALRTQISTDTHAPGEFRSDTVHNLGAWYEAFGVSAADKLYLGPERRVALW